MLEISTDKTKQKKQVKVDGFMYEVRKPGAGESLDFSRFGRQLSKIESKSNLTEEEEKKYAEMAEKILTICLDLFDPLDNADAKKYIRTLAPEILMETIGQVFGKEVISEPSDATTNA